MKKYLPLLAILLLIACLNACQKTCRCYHYNGDIIEYDVEELQEQGLSCIDMENINLGLTYSLCERVF